jgi:dienelactone hydrolase
MQQRYRPAQVGRWCAELDATLPGRMKAGGVISLLRRVTAGGYVRVIRVLLGLVVATAAAYAGGLQAGAANSGTPIPAPACAALGNCHYTVTPGTVAVLNGPNNDKPATIEYDIYKPDAATAATPQPAVIYFNGFGGGKGDSSGVAISDYLARHGYVAMPFSSEGFSHSTGFIELDSPEFDVKNVRALVGILGCQDYVFQDVAGSCPGTPGDPRVGTTGGSYGGAIQELSAEFDPRIDAITPFRTWSSLEYSLGPNNLSSGFQPQSLPCCGVIKWEWTSLFFASGASQPFLGNGSGLPGNFFNTQHIPPCPGFDDRLCTVYLETVATGQGSFAKPLLDNSSPATYIDGGQVADMTSHGLHVPTLLGQGQEDTLFNLNDATATYLALKARGVPVSMIWHSNGHGYDDAAGEGDVFGNDQTNLDQKYLPPRILAWFDHYLRVNPAVSTGAEFSYFRDWVPYSASSSAAPAYADSGGFPTEGDLTLGLSGAADLVAPGTPPLSGTATATNPGLPPQSYSETSNFQCPNCTVQGGAPSPFRDIAPFDPPCVGPACEFVSFTSNPFLRDVNSVGIPQAHLHITHTNPAADVVLFGKVYDLAPDGSSTLIKRLIAPIRAIDTAAPVDMNLLGFAHKFPQGHRVRFELATTDVTVNIDNNRVPDQVTLTQGGADPATFSLPVDGSTAGVVPPGYPSGGPVPSTALPNTAAAAPGAAPALDVALLGLASLVGLRAWRRRAVS